MSINHNDFEKSGLPPTDVIDGYIKWSASYDELLTDTIDGEILQSFIRRLPKESIEIVDLACGTGRNIVWLRNHGVSCIADGIDLSSHMIDKAIAKNIYRNLVVDDIQNCPFSSDQYQLAINILASCHMLSLDYLYQTASRLLQPGGALWIIDMHPYLFFAGRGTVVPIKDNEIYIQNYIHLFQDHHNEAKKSGFVLEDFKEILVPEEWGRTTPYKSFIGHPLSFGFFWKKDC